MTIMPVKRLYSVLAAAILFGSAIPAATAAVEVSVDFFHDHLDSHGDWREVGDYGWCWQPRDVGRNWRPYSDGRWLYTDAGWTWDSDEPYSWAVYHYGRWARVDRIGWVWVPGSEWGPAWVSWRRSARHVGWAPLPPEARFSRSVGFGPRVDADYDIGPTYYSFVEVRNFGAPHLRTVIVEPRENITIIRQTTNITRITYVNNIVYNEGPQYDVISRESAQPIRRLKLERREEFDGEPGAVRAEQLRTRVEGGSFRVLAPPFNSNPATAPRKVATKVEKAELDRGWKNAGPPAEVAKLRAKIKSEPATPVDPSPPKDEKAAEAPAESSDSPRVVEKPAKGKMREGNVPPSPAAPVATEVAPTSPEKAIVREKPAKSNKPAKDAKPVKPEADVQRTPPSAVEEAAPSIQSKKGGIKGIKAPRAPAEDAPKMQAPTRKKESVEPVRNLPPAVDETPRKKNHPGKGDAQPKPEQPAVRDNERKAPNIPKPRPETKRPESHEQVAPAASQPQPPPPAKGEGKGKGKDKKKDDGKPE